MLTSFADDSSQSSTYKGLDAEFSITYVDGSGASGAYFTDTFSIGDTTVQNLQVGLANVTAVGTGILGIGFELNEAAEQVYSNLVSTMVNQSKISTMAYSLYLNDYYSSTGSILFGGVDTDKFIGNMAIVPILPDSQSQNYSSFTVGLTGLSFASSNGTIYNQSLSSENDSLDSVLDSGTTLTYLPDSIASELFDAVGAYQYSSFASSSSIALVDCGMSLDFTFRINNTATITVPSDELVIDAFAGYQDTIPSAVPFASTCLFGIQNLGDTSDESGGFSTATADYAILGDSFLRSAYVVYDMANLQIGIAPANLNSTSTNVQELSAGESSLPQMSGVASQTASTGTSTSSATTSGTASGSGSGMLLSIGAGGASMSTAPCSSYVLATSVAAASPATTSTRMTTMTTMGTCLGVVVSLVTASMARTGTSVSNVSSGVYGLENATVATTTTTTNVVGVTGSSGAFLSSSVSFTDGSTATSSHKSAAMGRSAPGYEGLFAVVGITLAFAMSGSLLFWL